jgi:hypothetical protein
MRGLRFSALLFAGLIVATILILFSAAQIDVFAQGGRATATPAATATRARGLFGVPRATATPTRTPAVTPTITPTVEITGTPLPAPLALVVLPAPSVKNELAGDIVSPADVPVAVGYPMLYEDSLNFGMYNVRDLFAPDTYVATPNDSGIEFVHFAILDRHANLMYERTAENGAPFCAFGGGEFGTDTDCETLRFDSNNPRWPDGNPAVGGRYTLVAFAQGLEEARKGTWTLPFELRLSGEGIGDSDGAVRFLSAEREGEDLLVEVETFGFTPLMGGTHLHFFIDALDEVNASADTPGVIEYPTAYEEPSAWGAMTLRIPLAVLAFPPDYGMETGKLCVAIAHPDESILGGRGECVAVE